MKITSLEVHILRLKGDDPRPHWVSNFIVPRANEILVRMQDRRGHRGHRHRHQLHADRGGDQGLQGRHRGARDR
jgi:hypothetical protein